MKKLVLVVAASSTICAAKVQKSQLEMNAFLPGKSAELTKYALAQGRVVRSADGSKRAYTALRGNWEIYYYDAKPFNNAGVEDSLILNNLLTGEFYCDEGVNGYKKGEKFFSLNHNDGARASGALLTRAYNSIRE